MVKIFKDYLWLCPAFARTSAYLNPGALAPQTRSRPLKNEQYNRYHLIVKVCKTFAQFVKKKPCFQEPANLQTFFYSNYY